VQLLRAEERAEEDMLKAEQALQKVQHENSETAIDFIAEQVVKYEFALADVKCKAEGVMSILKRACVMETAHPTTVVSKTVVPKTVASEPFAKPSAEPLGDPFPSPAVPVVAELVSGDVARGREVGGTEGKGWSALDEKQQAAAQLLGYSAKAWNKDEKVPSLAKPWSKLSSDERSAWELLGWREHCWKQQLAHTELTVWKNLTEDERSAAMALGYDEAKWRTDGVVPTIGISWEKLPVDARTAWETLGWSSDNWAHRPLPMQ
jgi:hypothetical protein